MTNEEERLMRNLVDDVEFLLDYARRVAQHQVVRMDVNVIANIREHLKEVKEALN